VADILSQPPAKTEMLSKEKWSLQEGGRLLQFKGRGFETGGRPEQGGRKDGKVRGSPRGTAQRPKGKKGEGSNHSGRSRKNVAAPVGHRRAKVWRGEDGTSKEKRQREKGGEL